MPKLERVVTELPPSNQLRELDLHGPAGGLCKMFEDIRTGHIYVVTKVRNAAQVVRIVL